MTVYYANSLYHHGIKGQKWGVRRFQKKDGSLTPAGRKRYDDDGPSQKKQKEYKIPKNKSLHRLKIEEKYKAQGMSEKEAEQAAAKRIRGEQFAVGAAAVTVAACVAYNKYRNHNVDKVLKNAEFHRIMMTDNPDAPVREGARYVSYKKNDKMRYRGLYGNELKTKRAADGVMNIDMEEMAKKMGGKVPTDFNSIRKYAEENQTYKKNIYDMTIKSKGDIKVASEKRARETFEKLYKNDPEFRKNLAQRVEENRLNLLTKKGMMKGSVVDQLIEQGKDPKLRQLREMNDKELKGKAYDLFNIMLVDGDSRSRSNQKKFYDALKEQGMNAVQDMNDKKYSGYGTKNPLILFDGEFDYSKKVLSDSQIQKDLNKTLAQLYAKPAIAMGAAYVGGYGAIPMMNKVTLDKAAIYYKRQHPDTKMSDKEIKQMLMEQAKKQKK